MNRRVVVTGMGAITPIGKDVESFWNGIEGKKGRNCAYYSVWTQQIKPHCRRG